MDISSPVALQPGIYPFLLQTWFLSLFRCSKREITIFSSISNSHNCIIKLIHIWEPVHPPPPAIAFYLAQTCYNIVPLHRTPHCKEIHPLLPLWQHFTSVPPQLPYFPLQIFFHLKLPFIVAFIHNSSEIMLKGTRTMEAPVDLNIAPLNAPHRELEWLPLANRDYQMAEVIESSRKYHIPLINELKARHLSGTDILGILDSYLPIFYLPQVNVFPNLIDQCCTNYDPNQRAILSPSGSILFYLISFACISSLSSGLSRLLGSCRRGRNCSKMSRR